MFLLKDLSSQELCVFNLDQVLDIINMDRSSEWSDYDKNDWKEGWNEWCEGDVYTLLCDLDGLKKALLEIDGVDDFDWVTNTDERGFVELSFNSEKYAYLYVDCDTQILKKEMKKVVEKFLKFKNVELAGEGDSTFSLFIYL